VFAFGSPCRPETGPRTVALGFFVSEQAHGGQPAPRRIGQARNEKHADSEAHGGPTPAKTGHLPAVQNYGVSLLSVFRSYFRKNDFFQRTRRKRRRRYDHIYRLNYRVRLTRQKNCARVLRESSRKGTAFIFQSLTGSDPTGTRFGGKTGEISSDRLNEFVYVKDAKCRKIPPSRSFRNRKALANDANQSRVWTIKGPRNAKGHARSSSRKS